MDPLSNEVLCGEMLTCGIPIRKSCMRLGQKVKDIFHNSFNDFCHLDERTEVSPNGKKLPSADSLKHTYASPCTLQRFCRICNQIN